MRLIIYSFLLLTAYCNNNQILTRIRRQLSRQAVLWPDGKVYYYFNDDGATQDTGFKDYVRDAMDLISEISCISFEENARAHQKILIVRTLGCLSDIGMMPGTRNTIYLDNGCEEMEAVHEFLHALGFMHIHQRGDRDDYVTIKFANVLVSKKDNFEKRSWWKEIVPYDYGSIMHYGQYAFSNGRNLPTIVPTNEDYVQTIGSRKMSYYDIKMINDIYNLNCKKEDSANCKNYGYPNPSDCETCICPNGYGGTTCEDRTDDGCGAMFTASSEWAMGVLISNVLDPQQFDRPHYCNYWINAPQDKKIEVKINLLSQFVCREGCDYNYIEIKTDTDPRTSYPRFCCSNILDAGNVIKSSNPTIIVMASTQSRHVTARIEYRYGLRFQWEQTILVGNDDNEDGDDEEDDDDDESNSNKKDEAEEKDNDDKDEGDGDKNDE